MKNYQRKEVESSFGLFSKINFLGKKSKTKKISDVSLTENKALANLFGSGWVATKLGAEWKQTINSVDVTLRIKKNIEGKYSANFNLNTSNLLNSVELESLNECIMEVKKSIMRLNQALMRVNVGCVSKLLESSNDV
jgi:hypothetical protein